MESAQVFIMTIEDVAAYLRIPLSSAYKLAQDGKIPGQKVGRHWRFRRETIDHWLDDTNGRLGKNTSLQDDDAHERRIG
jgi:excisionase family DNA binding protein